MRKIERILLALSIAVPPLGGGGGLSAQNVTYNHDSPKMNQFTVAEIGSGGLTPSLYYDLLHNKYRNEAARKNKLGFRTTASVAGYWQVDDAEKLDSAMIKRVEIEALNVADRQIDLAWMAEKNKITNKLSDFQRNINRIVSVGGTPAQKQMWTDIYNLSQTALKATQEAYMPNSQRKRQYLQIYADLARQNETLVKFLVYLSTSKTTASLLVSTYDKPNSMAQHAADALSRWRDAAWSVKSKDDNKFEWIIDPGKWRPFEPELWEWGEIKIDPEFSRP